MKTADTQQIRMIVDYTPQIEQARQKLAATVDPKEKFARLLFLGVLQGLQRSQFTQKD